jgi:hypothetical protein
VLVFCHIPKTAGTAVTAALRQMVGDSRTLHAGRPSETAAFRSMTPADISQYEVVSGHIPIADLLRVCGPNAIYCSLVREPVARMTSFFAHVARDPSNPDHSRSQNGIDAWLDWLADDEHRVQLHSQSFFLDGAPDGTLVGRQDDVTEFLLRVAGAAGLEPHHVQQLNVGREKPDVTPQTIRRIREMFAADVTLYNSLDYS